jgi:radical SAM/Cys-rich protein
MNTFDLKIKQCGKYPLTASNISTLQVNIGYTCNLTCSHCHVEASPHRKESMSLSTITTILDILNDNDAITTVDITGGSPELNPHFRELVKSCSLLGKTVIVRTNLAIYSEPGMEDIPEFLAAHKVKVVASLPCYSEEGVDSQRGKGTYEKAVSALEQLNELGYGKDNTCLMLDIMFNPAKIDIAPDQKMLENAYREKLRDMHGIVFNNLIALSNMPIGRLGKSVSAEEHTGYVHKLVEQFNPATLDQVMCKSLISISPDGKIYDCDFWQMLNLPVRSEHTDISNFNYRALSSREIVTNALCFLCTAGAGASCSGALA